MDKALEKIVQFLSIAQDIGHRHTYLDVWGNARTLLSDLKELGYRKLPEGEPPDDDIIEDGFGCSCSVYCSECGKKSMYVSGPGDIRCANCYG